MRTYASRKGMQNAQQVMIHGTTTTSNLKIMLWNYRGYPWDKALGLSSDVAQSIDVICLVEIWEHDAQGNKVWLNVMHISIGPQNSKTRRGQGRVARLIRMDRNLMLQ